MRNRRLSLIEDWPAEAAACAFQLQNIANKFGTAALLPKKPQKPNVDDALEQSEDILKNLPKPPKAQDKI